MSDGRNLICTFDGSFDGFLSVVYYAVKNRVRPVRVCVKNGVQLAFDSEEIFVETNAADADTVRQSVCEIMGYDGFRRAYCAFLCCDKDSATVSYKYLLYGLKYGRKTHNYMSVPDINMAYKMDRRVSYEVDRMKGFLRFSVMEGGVEYAQMEPKNDILALVMPHFADRLKSIPFVIHDVGRKKAGVYARGSWFITDATELVPPDLDKDEKHYREMWHSFYKAISIKERKNERLQGQMMPKFYRKHMTEHNVF